MARRQNRTGVQSPIGAIASLLLLAGCSGSSTLTTADLPSVGALPDLPSLSSFAPKTVVGTPTEVYTRIARGAVTCWFGATGPLKGDHIYHADAQPQSKGGAAEITIFQKDVAHPDPRALKAYWIGIVPTGEIPRVEVQNFKIAEPLASRMQADVNRWASSTNEGCLEVPALQDWSAQQQTPHDKKKAAKK
jgi:hypothetical protein